MITHAIIGLLTITAADGNTVPSLHRDKASARAALAVFARERWDRVAGRDLGNGLAVAADPTGLSDKRIALRQEWPT